LTAKYAGTSSQIKQNTNIELNRISDQQLRLGLIENKTETEIRLNATSTDSLKFNEFKQDDQLEI